MSDREDSKTPESTPSHVPAETLVMNSSPIIRYTKQALLSLHDSPLVAKPADMPALSSWFGEDPDTPISKNILNGSTPTRNSDKNVLLAPNKSVFSSASYGKRQEDTVNNRSSASRYRHAADETRTRDYGMPSKDARPLRSSEKSYTTRGSDKAERRSTSSQNGAISSNNKRQQQQQQQQQQPISANEATRYRRDTRTSRSSNADNPTSRSSDRLPEWMDYNPTLDSSSHSIEKPKQSRQTSRPEVINDLEAWKRDMKQKEFGNGIDPMPEKDSVGADTRKAGKELGLTLGIGSLDLQSSTPRLQQQQQQQQQEQQAFDFLSVSALEGTGSPSNAGGRLERGSRFAKFFAKRDEEALTPAMQSEPQSRSITVHDLFRGVEGQAPAADNTVDARMQQPSRPIAPEPITGSPGARMLSEEEVMRTLGARKSPGSMQPSQPTSDNTMGFDKVLQILSQPKPTAASQQQQRPSSNQNEKDDEADEIKNQNVDPEAIASPNFAHAEKQVVTETSHHQQPQVQKPKVANNRFAGNLPTSVLRQMSARSSEGRSPSLSSNKSARSFATGSSSSPALSKASPASMKGSLPIVSQDSNPPNGHPYPTAPIYHRIPPTSPGYTLAGIVNPVTDPSMVPVRQPRSNGPAFDHLLQYAEPVIGRAGPMNPMIPPPLSYGQGQQQQQRQQQQQQGMDQFMAPHVMQPMPPHMPPVGPGGHMIPPHHLPLHLQGQIPPAFASIQREIMTPPGVPPPHMMGCAGLPPHHYPKGPGWDRH